MRGAGCARSPAGAHGDGARAAAAAAGGQEPRHHAAGGVGGAEPPHVQGPRVWPAGVRGDRGRPRARRLPGAAVPMCALLTALLQNIWCNQREPAAVYILSRTGKLPMVMSLASFRPASVVLILGDATCLEVAWHSVVQGTLQVFLSVASLSVNFVLPCRHLQDR